MSPQQPERRAKQAWHLDKTVSIGHLITTLTVAGSVLIWAMNVSTRVSVLESEVVHGKLMDERLESQLKESVQRIEAAVVRIEAAVAQKADKK